MKVFTFIFQSLGHITTSLSEKSKVSKFGQVVGNEKFFIEGLEGED